MMLDCPIQSCLEKQAREAPHWVLGSREHCISQTRVLADDHLGISVAWDPVLNMSTAQPVTQDIHS